MKEDTITVVFATDSAFKHYTGVALFSLITNSSSQHYYRIVILEENLSEEDKEGYRRMIQTRHNFELIFINMEDKILAIGREQFYTSVYSHANYYRLFLPEILSDCAKIIYLDSDVIVQNDLVEFWQMDLANHPLAGCIDWGITHYLMHDFMGLYLRKYARMTLNIKKVSGYINSGVLLMNLDYLRKVHFHQLFVQELQTKIPFALVDQDILNRLFENDILYFSTKWNCSPYYLPLEIEHSYIIHFSGMKPWKSRSIPHCELWWKYADDSPYSKQLNSKLSADYDQVIAELYAIKESSIWRYSSFYRHAKELIKYLLHQ